MGVPWQARVSLFCMVLAFIFLVISHMSPNWYHEDPYTHIGLWEKCEWRKPCVWSHDDHFYWEIIQPAWWKVCQVLYSLALLTVFITLCLTIEINCRVNVQKLPKIVNGTFQFLAIIEILATLAHFGRMAHGERGVVIDDEAYRNFGWAYLLGCLALVFLITAFIFFLLNLKREKYKEKRAENEFNNPMLGGLPPMMQPAGSQYAGSQYTSQQFSQGPPPQHQLQPPPQGHFRPPPGHYAPQAGQQYQPQQQGYAQSKQSLNYSR